METLLRVENILACIGNTPLVKFEHITKSLNKHICIFAKLECLNPSGSIKDRIAKFIIEDAEKKGLLKPGGVIVENSSGNTGAALAMIAAIKNYKCIITMPDKMSIEKRSLIQSYGAKVIVTPTEVPAESEESYYSVARHIAKTTEGSFYPDQYNNSLNIQAHYETTGPEIWDQMQGEIDILIAGVGTGGTLSGVARYLKSKNNNIQIIAVDPIGSVFYHYFKYKKMVEPKLYKVEGIGEDYLVKALDFTVIDDMIQVSDRDSFLKARELARKEGIFAGGSSGSAVHVALEVAEKLSNSNPKRRIHILVILPDSGDRYLSKFYNDDWMKKNGFL